MSLASHLPLCGFLFFTSFMFIRSLLLCPLHSLAAMSQRTSSKNTESISVSRALRCCSYVSGQREESFRGEVTLTAFAYSPVLPNFLSPFKPFFMFTNIKTLDKGGQCVCVYVCVSVEVWTQVPLALVFFLTPEARVLVCVFPGMTHWVAAGAGQDNDSEVCRSGIGCVFVN